MAPGYNPKHGYDSGPPPPGFPASQPPRVQYVPVQPGWPPGFPQPQLARPNVVYVQPPPANIILQQPGVFAPPPPPPLTVPGINLQNSTGGTGLPLGYNYIFPQEHTQIHV